MNTVYVSSCLASRHPDVHLALSLALQDHAIPLVEVESTNIWLRDWMPIQVGDHFVKFRGHTNTPENVKRWPQLEVKDECWSFIEDQAHHDHDCGEDDWKIVEESDLILDGGNVVRSPDGKRVIMTEQTLYDNIHYDFGAKGSKRTFEDLLEAEIIWIDSEPDDDLGHADGIVQWVNNGCCAVNDYRSIRSREWSDYQDKLLATLNKHGIGTVTFPWAGDIQREIDETRFRTEHPLGDDWNDGTGWYINYLKIDRPPIHESRRNHLPPPLILYPKFNIDRDERCLDCLLDAFPGADCRGIDCTYLAEEGGLLRCVTAVF
jgi:agmatine deiminase